MSYPSYAYWFCSLPFIIQNSDALQDTLLVAGLHYTLATGDIRTYDSTVLFHKVETIRSINKRLETPRSTGFTTLVRRIATLCLVEVRFDLCLCEHVFRPSMILPLSSTYRS